MGTKKQNQLPLLFLIFLAISFGFLLKHELTGTYEINMNTLTLKKFDEISRVQCTSDSMGLIISCKDKIYLRHLQKDEKLIIGEMYVYRDNNESVLHRLVQCIDDCSIAVFKGDNNYIAEFINRSQVVKKVERIDYR